MLVSIPSDVLLRGKGFRFPLPESVWASELRVTLMNGDALPLGVRYEPETRTVVVSAAYAGGLPLHLLVTARDRRTVLVVSEQVAN
jgi:hypothetical protein